MRECAYGKEPLDFKLMCLLLIKRIWMFVVATAVGGLLVGGTYFVTEILLGEGVTYQATSTYYVEYGTDPQTGNEITYINGVTWDTTWIKSDEFIQNVRELVGGKAQEMTGMELTAERLKGYLSAALPSDLRMPTTTVKTESTELTMLLIPAVEEAMVMFGANPEYREIDEIKVVISPEFAERTVIDDRTVNAVILGAFLGLLFAAVTWCIRYFLDDSVYVPTTFEYRYDIPMLGTLESPYLRENFKHLFAGKEKIAVLGVNSDADIASVTKELDKTLWGNKASEAEHSNHMRTAGWQLTAMPGLEQCPEALECIREQDGLLLCVEAGARDGKRIEELLQLFKKQEIAVTAALLTDADEVLQKVYYLHK